jgi:hypothetical protein
MEQVVVAGVAYDRNEAKVSSHRNAESPVIASSSNPTVASAPVQRSALERPRLEPTWQEEPGRQPQI